MKAAGIGTGDEVILPAYGGREVAEAVRAVGARPVLADIDPRSYCLDPAAVAAAVTPRTAAVAPVHLFGHPADMTRLRELARHHGLAVLEFGERPQVTSVDSVRRRRHAEYLGARLTGVVVPSLGHDVAHACTQYVVRVPGNGRPDRDAFRQALRSRGVECRVPVQAPVHRIPGFQADVRLPEAERAADESLALPVDESLTRRDLHRVVAACNSLGGLLHEQAC